MALRSPENNTQPTTRPKAVIGLLSFPINDNDNNDNNNNT